MTSNFNPANPASPETVNSLTGESYLEYCNRTDQMAIDWGWNVWTYLMPQLNGWIETAAQHGRNENYYRNICVEIGKLLGPEIYICDDGTVVDEVLIAKLVEVAQSKLQQQLRRAHEEVEEDDDGNPYRNDNDPAIVEMYNYGQKIINLGKAFQSPTTTIIDLKYQARNLGFDLDIKLIDSEW